ncbi:hypothetical protein R3P38DRAFT_3212446 [Favolaschia claudopus]|uniref:F-box domain-containing protein n=1 Tax=Favolaschia claudopus TaxID=2862362 RepID=A0AAW0ADQ1_9AGAR
MQSWPYTDLLCESTWPGEPVIGICPAQRRLWSKRNLIAIECFRTLRAERWRDFGGNSPRRFEFFPEMPFDIVLEVLKYLHPLDLLHVSRTDRGFRNLLHSPDFDAVWRTSFATGPLPQCPNDITGWQWAHLLFGDHICQECNKNKALPDFMILKRLCTRCMSNSLCSSIDLIRHRAHVLIDLIPLTRRCHGDKDDYYRALVVEAEPVVAKYELLALQTENGDPDALAAFVREREHIVQERHKAEARAMKWIKSMTQQRQDRDTENRKRIYAIIEKQLEAEGHDLRDIRNVMSRFQDASRWSSDYSNLDTLSGIVRLSPKRRNKAHSTLKLPLLGQRTRRLNEEETDRFRVVFRAVTKILRLRAASTWIWTPTGEEIAKYPDFHALIERETPGIGGKNEHQSSDVILAEDDPRLLAALDTLPDRLDSEIAALRHSRLAMLPDNLVYYDQQERNGVDVFELATTVFTCGGPLDTEIHLPACCLVGWKEIGARHHYQGSYRTSDCGLDTTVFCEIASTAARALVKLVGLDPCTAMVDHMDALDARFVCEDCSSSEALEVMGWRLCLQHALEHTPQETGPVRHISSWALLSIEAAKYVRFREIQDPTHESNAWLCNLCPVHHEYQVKRSTVIDHVLAVHEITFPIEGTDFVCHFPRPHSPRQFPVYIPCNDYGLPEYDCDRCASGRPLLNAPKLRTLRDILRHVRQKHEVDPTEKDYTKQSFRLRSSREMIY